MTRPPYLPPSVPSWSAHGLRMTVWPALACTVLLAGCGLTPVGVGTTAPVQTPSGSGQPSVPDCERSQDAVATYPSPLVEGQAPPAKAPNLSIADARISPVAADWPDGVSVRSIRPTSDDPNRLPHADIPSTYVLDFSIEGMYQPLLLELVTYSSMPERLSEMTPRDAFFCSARLVSRSSAGSSYRSQLPQGITVVVIQGFFPKPPGAVMPALQL